MSLPRLRTRFETWARPRQPETLPARIDRRRVYVLPTRFGLFFALLLAAMGLGALNYNNNPALLLVLLLAGAANASLLVAHLQLTGLQIGAIGAEPVPAGSVMSLRVHARAAPGRNRRGRFCAAINPVADDPGFVIGYLAVRRRHRFLRDALKQPALLRRTLDQRRPLLASTRHRRQRPQIQLAHLHRRAVTRQAILSKDGQNLFFELRRGLGRQ